MKELFKAVIAIHKGFTMTGYEWEPQWTSHCSTDTNIISTNQ